MFRPKPRPHAGPKVHAATRNAIATIWKIVLVVEFLGRPNGVDLQIHRHFQLFETGYVLSFVVLMLDLECGLFAPCAETQGLRPGAFLGRLPFAKDGV